MSRYREGLTRTHASEGKYFRRVLRRGLLGSFGLGAMTINQANAVMAEGARRLAEAETRRLQLADSLDTAVKGVAEHVAAASTEMRSTAGGLAQSERQVAAASRAARDAVLETERIGSSIRKVDEIASTITLAVGEQRQATNDISRNIHQTAGQMESAAADLSDLSERLRSEVDRFLREIRQG